MKTDRSSLVKSYGMPECTYEGGEEHAAEGGEPASWAHDKL